MRSITSDDVQLVDALLNEGFDDLIHIESSPRTAENSAPQVLQLPYVLFVQLHPVVLPRVHSHVAELNPPHLWAPVQVHQTSVDLPDHDV